MSLVEEVLLPHDFLNFQAPINIISKLKILFQAGNIPLLSKISVWKNDRDLRHFEIINLSSFRQETMRVMQLVPSGV